MKLLALLLWREWRHHPARHAAAMLAVALGVALAGAVHLINHSALAEFSAAVQSANGEPDLVLRGPREGFDDTLFERVALEAAVELASPVLEIDTYGRAAAPARPAERVPLRVVGVDLLRAPAVAPQLLPRPAPGSDRLAIVDPELVFANVAALKALGVNEGEMLALQNGAGWTTLRIGGTLPAGGAPLLVLDIAAAQLRFGREGRLSRIDLRLVPGADAQALVGRLVLPDGVAAVPPEQAEQRISQLSRAYRVNLTVLAAVALVVGGFMVFSVLALTVAQRTPALALLGVLGMGERDRRRWVLAESLALGLVGGLLGIVLAIVLAAAALRLLSGDLGGGYFPGITPALRIEPLHLVLLLLLGLASAVAGAWLPARAAERIAPARALKGLGSRDTAAPPLWPGLVLLAAGVAAALLPPVAGLPLAAYASVAALLVGGVSLVPAAVHALLHAVPRPGRALPLLALARARHQRATATAAVAGVVASLALSVALTVMVASFREGVARWLDHVLPADLYARSAGSAAAAENAWLPRQMTERAAALPGVQRVQAARTRPLQLEPARPAVVLVARPLADAAAELPMRGLPLPASGVQPGETAVWVSEAMVALYGAAPGQRLELPLAGPDGLLRRPVRVLGVWRDYARQFGTVVMAEADYRRLTGDDRVNELAVWLAPGASLAAVQQGLREAAPAGVPIEFASSAELRRLSLRIFDRSFAVTVWLQAVAIGIGLLGVAASLSAQVLARRKEFGLLVHLGLTRAQVLAVVAGESAAWMAAGTLVGLVLGGAISVVLVHVVNPQSFHWTMELVLPLARLAALAAAVWLAGTATALWAARRATGAGAVRAVKEDW